MAGFSTPVRSGEATEGAQRVPRAGAEGEFTHRSQGAIRARDWPGYGQDSEKCIFIGRHYRKKKALSLCAVRATQKACKLLKVMWSPPRNDEHYLKGQWYSSILSSHSAFCGCPDAVAHFNHLATVLRAPENPGPPGGHRPSPLRVLPALPAAPEAPGDRAPWPMGCGGDGEGGGRGGDADGGDAAGGPADADLLDAVDAAEQ
nr:ORF2 protein [Torque teno virus]